MAAIGKGRGAVAVLSWHGEGSNLLKAKVDNLGCRDILLGSLGALEFFEILGDVIAEVRRNNGGRRLHSTESEVVSRRGNGHAHKVTVEVNRADHGSHENRENFVRARGLRELLGVEEVDSGVGAERDVVMLAGTVDILEGFLLR
eukprot:scaffold59563_cov30-Tisochrysis_lutea.AAC.3